MGGVHEVNGKGRVLLGHLSEQLLVLPLYPSKTSSTKYWPAIVYGNRRSRETEPSNSGTPAVAECLDDSPAKSVRLSIATTK
jgi:hypothetical protein